MALRMLVMPLLATLCVSIDSSYVRGAALHSSLFTEDMVGDALDNADTLLNDVNCGKHLENAMKHVARTQYNDIMRIVCMKHAPEKVDCVKTLRKYLQRCSKGDCFRLDDQFLDRSDRSHLIKLPNKYQLDAVFALYKKSDIYPINGFTENLRMSLRKGGRYIAYKQFLLHLFMANFDEDKGGSKLDCFMRKYFFMAAVYYKTYLMLDDWKARIQNLTRYSQVFFASGIQQALTQIIANNVTKAVIGISPEEIKPYMKCFPEYIATFRARMNTFAKAYTAIVVIALRSSITNIRHLQTSAARYLGQPWVNLYNRLLKPVLKTIGKVLLAPLKFIWRNVYNLLGPPDLNELSNFGVDLGHDHMKMLNKQFENDKVETDANVEDDDMVIFEDEQGDSNHYLTNADEIGHEPIADYVRQPHSPARHRSKGNTSEENRGFVSTASYNDNEVSLDDTTYDDETIHELAKISAMKAIKNHQHRAGGLDQISTPIIEEVE
ncbi:rhoptry-associated protein 1 (RAP-1) [Babesia divergens]|uniref:Rhoptry-associated protein 1 (RAP-1) n=1 Tax=Babesia divergens TaxID=32595 RepID=A0AAD9GCP5_BABDI|nr:rhoptry-associated protein 1 (RAP-1) [Babesia divergens]